MIVCAMIIGPGEGNRYLDMALARAATWADKTIVYTDHIDAGTEAVLDRHNVVTYRVNEAGHAPRFTEDESYVRNKLMEALDMLSRAGSLVVVLDADEVLHAGEEGVRTALTALDEGDGEHAAWSATFYHLWNPEGTMYRTDGGWAPAPQFRVYRHEPGDRIEERRMACRAIPSSNAGRRAHSTLAVAHWGYARPEDRRAKHCRYMELDGGRFHSRRHLESIIERPTLLPLPPALHG